MLIWATLNWHIDKWIGINFFKFSLVKMNSYSQQAFINLFYHITFTFLYLTKSLFFFFLKHISQYYIGLTISQFKFLQTALLKILQWLQKCLSAQIAVLNLTTGLHSQSYTGCVRFVLLVYWKSLLLWLEYLVSQLNCHLPQLKH